MSARLAVVSAGVGQPSATRLLADRLAAATARAVQATGESAEVQVIELRGYAKDLANQIVTGVASPRLAAAARSVAEADAVIAVSPIFNASYSGLFKLFFDTLQVDALTGVPVLIAATGGTARHSLALEHALRPLFSYLRASVVPTAVYAATEDWAAPAELTARIDRAAAELAVPLAGTRTPPRARSQTSADLGTGGFERLLAVHNGQGRKAH